MNNRPGALAFLLLFVQAIIWGSSFILMKKGLKVFSAVEVGTIRMTAAFICLLPLTILNFRKVERKDWWALTWVGLSGNAIPAILFATAQTHISSSLAGGLNALVPIFAWLISVLVYKQTFSRYKFIGILVGLAGALLLISSRSVGSAGSNPWYGLFILAATILYGISVNLIKNRLSHLPSLVISSMALSFIGPFYGAYLLFFTDFGTHMTSPGGYEALGYLLILAAFGTALSLVLYNKLVELTNVVFSSSVTYLIPIVAAMWGMIDGEAIGWMQVLGMCFILGGVYLSSRS